MSAVNMALLNHAGQPGGFSLTTAAQPHTCIGCGGDADYVQQVHVPQQAASYFTGPLAPLYAAGSYYVATCAPSGMCGAPQGNGASLPWLLVRALLLAGHASQLASALEKAGFSAWQASGTKAGWYLDFGDECLLANGLYWQVSYTGCGASAATEQAVIHAYAMALQHYSRASVQPPGDGYVGWHVWVDLPSPCLACGASCAAGSAYCGGTACNVQACNSCGRPAMWQLYTPAPHFNGAASPPDLDAYMCTACLPVALLEANEGTDPVAVKPYKAGPVCVAMFGTPPGQPCGQPAAHTVWWPELGRPADTVCAAHLAPWLQQAADDSGATAATVTTLAGML